MNGSLVFSALSLTKITNPPKRVLKVMRREDISEEGTPRYEYFRGVEGDVVLDMTDMRGIEDMGDRLKVLPGTPWSDVMKYSVETFGLMEASVGGSVAFSDAGFGFNEFGPISRRVEVEAMLSGQTYVGEYRGGVILSVTLRKDPRPLEYRKLERDFEFLIRRVRYWFSYSLPPFRDVTVIKNGDKATLYVAYPKSREALLSEKLEGMTPTSPYSFELGNYRFRYFGELRTESLSGTQFPDAEKICLFVRKDVTRFVVLSSTPLDFPQGVVLYPYSTEGRTDLFQGCILCGRCVSVCPHGQQRGNKDYTPLGFFIASVNGREEEYANCHMCGKCDEVCPAKLDIVGRLKGKAKLRSHEIDVVLNFPAKKVILLTPISRELKKELVDVLNLLSSLGMKFGVLTLNVPLEKLVKGELELSLPQEVEQIYTLTPEEAYYLMQLRSRRVTDVSFLYDELPEPLKKSVTDKRVHRPCFYKGRTKGEEKCSFALLELVNGEPTSTPSVGAEITLCPLAGKKLGIPSYLDVITPSTEGKQGARGVSDEILRTFKEGEKVMKDMEWYEGLDDTLIQDYVRGLLRGVLKGKGVGDLISLYLGLGDLFKSSEEEWLLKIIEEEVRREIMN